jgi:4-amino-4-deoxy-L-arabinose transferase-like glycosyltransferase
MEAVPRLIPQAERRTTRRDCAVDLLIIACLWCISLAIVSPRGDFPLNDDWVYGRTVRDFVASGHYLPPGEEVTFITNVLWGSLFCIPAGFSFNALRLSTLVLSLLGIFGTYFLMRELRQPRWSAVMAALVLGFNPIYYALSNTFMTDVPCTAIAVVAALFLV